MLSTCSSVAEIRETVETMQAGEYPTKPVRIVAAEPGGGTDFVSRMVAQGVSGALGQQVLVENRPSALSGETVAKSPPDGYTLLLNPGLTGINKSLLKSVPWRAGVF